MPEGRRFTQTAFLERLAKEAAQLRKEAQGTTSWSAKPAEPRRLLMRPSGCRRATKHQDRFEQWPFIAY